MSFSPKKTGEGEPAGQTVKEHAKKGKHKGREVVHLNKPPSPSPTRTRADSTVEKGRVQSTRAFFESQTPNESNKEKKKEREGKKHHSNSVPRLRPLNRASTENDLQKHSSHFSPRVRGLLNAIAHPTRKSKEESPPLETPIVERPSPFVVQWERELQKRLEKHVLEVKEKTLLISVQKFIQKEGLDILNIPDSLTKGIKETEEYTHLLPFLKIETPQEFLEKYSELEQEDAKLLIHLIGGEEVLNCLKLYLDPEAQKRWAIVGEKVIWLDQAPWHLPSHVKSYEIGFDKERPIAEIGRETILGNFRAYYGDEEIPLVLEINGKMVEKPDLKEYPKEKRDVPFFTWLISELTPYLKVDKTTEEKKTLSIKQQAKLLCSERIPAKTRKNLSKAINSDCNEYVMSKKKQPLETLVESLGEKITETLSPKKEKEKDHQVDEKAKAFVIKFKKWANIHLTEILKVDRTHETSIYGNSVIEAFEHHLWLKRCEKYVDCLRPIQTLTPSAFSSVHFTMRGHSPRLFSSALGEPKLTSTSDHRRTYKMRFEDTGAYTVKHRKLYTIEGKEIVHAGEEERGPIEYRVIHYGSLFACLKLKGTFGFLETIFTATHHCEKLEVSSDHSVEIRWKIYENLGLIPPHVLERFEHQHRKTI